MARSARREIARVTMPRNPARPDQDGRRHEEGRALLVGPPVEALREWLERADIKKGPIFRAIDRWEAVEEKALTPQSINLIEAALRRGGVGPGGGFGAWFTGRVSGRGGAAQHRFGPGGHELLQ